MGQAEMHAAAKSANLERLEEQMTTLALQTTADSHAAASSASTISSKQDSKGVCIVCMEEEKSVLLMPCKHLCMCKGCTDKLIAQSGRRKAMCPVCRNLIMDTIEAFV